MADQVSDYLHSPFTLVTAARFGGPWEFILTRTDFDGGGREDITPSAIWKWVRFRISTFSGISVVDIRINDGDIDNPEVVITTVVGFEPAIFNSISYDATLNKWIINIRNSPDEPGTQPVSGNPNPANFGTSYNFQISAHKNHNLIQPSTGLVYPSADSGFTAGRFDGCMDVITRQEVLGSVVSLDNGIVGYLGQTNKLVFTTVVTGETVNFLKDDEDAERFLDVQDFETEFITLPAAFAVPGLYIIDMPGVQLDWTYRAVLLTLDLQDHVNVITDQPFGMGFSASNVPPFEGTDKNAAALQSTPSQISYQPIFWRNFVSNFGQNALINTNEIHRNSIISGTPTTQDLTNSALSTPVNVKSFDGISFASFNTIFNPAITLPDFL